MQPTVPHPTDGLWRDWGAAVKHQREHVVKITQRELAQAIGVTIGTISDIERGAAEGSRQTKFDIAQALGCEVDELFSWPSTKQPIEAAS